MLRIILNASTHSLMLRIVLNVKNYSKHLDLFQTLRIVLSADNCSISAASYGSSATASTAINSIRTGSTDSVHMERI